MKLVPYVWSSVSLAEVSIAVGSILSKHVSDLTPRDVHAIVAANNTARPARTPRCQGSANDHMEQRIRRTVLFLFFVSGVSGLIYEVAWTRLLTTIVGNTVHAVTIVLAAFMGGLALGSQVGGWLIDRRRDALRVFAVLQLVIGIISFYLTMALSAASPVYVWLHRIAEGNTMLLNGGRLAFSFCLLAVPTTLMGATLPVLSRAVVQRRSTLGLELGTLYALNTFGAAAGCYLAGFVLIGGVGIRISTWGAAVLNVAVGVWAYVYCRRLGRPDETERIEATESEPTATRRPVALLVLSAMAVSGFAALGYEVLWTRALVFFMGNSVYAFSAMLTTFLAGLALGSMATARLADRWRRPVLVLGLIEAGIGTCALLSILLFAWGLRCGDSVFSPLFWQRPLSQFAKASAIMFVPTFLLGATFPLAARVYVPHLRQVGRNVGTLYMWNTLGGILGAVVTGFALLPAFGVEGSLRLLCLINMLLGVVLAMAEGAVRWRWRVVLAVALVSTGVVGVRAVPRDVFRRLHEGGPTDAKVIAYHEDATGAVAVVQERENVSLRIDNHPMAGTEFGYLCSQRFLGHLPMLLHPNPQAVYVLGFGAGASCYWVSTHPGVKRIDTAELCPGVVRFAPLLAGLNHNILAEPYVTLDVNDGRNALLATRQMYDVISVDLLQPHAAGAGSLYTKEFYEVCSQRLNDGGIVAEWISPHRVPPAHLRIILSTVQSVFPHVALWYTRQYTHLVLVASRSPMRIDYTRLTSRMGAADVAASLSDIGVDGPAALLSYFVADDEALARFAGGTGLINTDDLPFLEFALPILRVNPHVLSMGNLKATSEMKESIVPRLGNLGANAEEHQRVAERIWSHERARGLAVKVALAADKGDPGSALEMCTKAVEINPEDREAADFMESYQKFVRSQTEPSGADKPDGQ